MDYNIITSYVSPTTITATLRLKLKKKKLYSFNNAMKNNNTVTGNTK